MADDGLSIDMDFTFNPDTWCRDTAAINIDKRPIRKLICVAIELLDIMTPVTRFIELIINMIRDFILDNHQITEIVIILSPAIPIAYLVGYFFDTL